MSKQQTAKEVERLFGMKLRTASYSSVVGSALTIEDESGMVVAMLIISVPNPSLDYKTISAAVTKALTTHGTEQGKLTLVLPSNALRGNNV